MFAKCSLVTAAMIVAVTGFNSCVDIPGGPPASALDMRAQIRFAHVGYGNDTIAIAFPGGSTDTLHALFTSQWTVPSDSDSVVVTDSSFVTTYPPLYFHRFHVDFSQPLDVLEDGALIGHLNFGETTPYLDNPAGARDLSLKGLGTIVDTLVVQIADTHHVVHRDTVGKGSSKSDTLIASRFYSVMTAASGAVPEFITVDYKNPKLIVLTDRKATVFFIHDLQPIIAQEGNRVRYGWINYHIADERYSDRIFRGTPSVSADSFAIRFINASRNASGIRMTAKGVVGAPDPTAISVVSDSIAFLTTLAYRVLQEGQYAVYLSNAGSAAPVDSLTSLSLASHHRYSIVAVDSANTFRLREYVDD